MENKKNIVQNYIYNLIYQIFIVVIPIITTPYLSRVLGAEKLGIYGYTMSIVSYFTLFASLGISKHGQREIAYVQEDKEKRSKIFWELNIIRLITTMVASIIFFIVFCIQGKYVIYYKILILELLAIILDISWFFQGIEDFKKVVLRNTIIKIVSIILIFLLVKTPDDLIKYFIIYVLSNFIGNATFWLKINKYVYIIKINFKDLKKHIKPMLTLFMPQIAVSIYTVLDKTMLGTLLTDISEVGYYEQSQKIVKIALTLVTTMSIVMMPRISNTFSKGNNEKIKQYMKKSFRFNWFLSIPIMFGIMATAPKLVPWFFGQGYNKVILLMQCTCPIVVFIAFSTTIGSQYLISIKKQNIHTIAVVLGAIINIILNTILIQKFQSLGAAIATVISECIIAILEIIYIISNKYMQIKDIFNGITKYLISGIIMYIVVTTISSYMSIGMINTLIQIVIGISTYMMLLIVFKDDFIISISNMVFEKSKILKNINNNKKTEGDN